MRAGRSQAGSGGLRRSAVQAATAAAGAAARLQVQRSGGGGGDALLPAAAAQRYAHQPAGPSNLRALPPSAPRRTPRPAALPGHSPSPPLSPAPPHSAGAASGCRCLRPGRAWVAVRAARVGGRAGQERGCERCSARAAQPRPPCRFVESPWQAHSHACAAQPALPAPSRHKRASARTRPNLQHQVARLHPRRRHNPRQHAVIQHEVLAQRPALAGRRQRLAGPGQVGQPRASVCRRQAAVAAAQQRRRPSLLGSQILLRQPLARVGGLAIPQPAHCGHRWRRARPGGGAWLQLRSDRCYMPSLGSGRRT